MDTCIAWTHLSCLLPWLLLVAILDESFSQILKVLLTQNIVLHTIGALCLVLLHTHLVSSANFSFPFLPETEYEIEGVPKSLPGTLCTPMNFGRLRRVRAGEFGLLGIATFGTMRYSRPDVSTVYVGLEARYCLDIANCIWHDHQAIEMLYHKANRQSLEKMNQDTELDFFMTAIEAKEHLGDGVIMNPLSSPTIADYCIMLNKNVLLGIGFGFPRYWIKSQPLHYLIKRFQDM
ncbi:hypothetical protein VNO80_04507 [Phaseolus coccineus]|uniref:Uncharacterized protein n=1 Tax=Phaseolus coccineus TaxID=3886 RepID=A0AAN9RNS9_PHACN